MIVNWKDHKNGQETFSQILNKAYRMALQKKDLFDDSKFDSSKINIKFLFEGVEIDLIEICSEIDETKRENNSQIYREGLKAGIESVKQRFNDKYFNFDTEEMSKDYE